MDDGTVLGRAADIIAAVSESIDPISLAELTRVTGIPKPTVRRIANSLVVRGFLDHGPDGYATGCALMRHGVRALQRRRLDVVARPYVEDLYQRCRGAVAWYAAFDDGEATMVAAAHGRLAQRLVPSLWPGSGSPGKEFALTVVGRTILAADDARLEKTIAAGLRPLTPYSVTAPSSFRRLAARASEARYAEEIEQVRLGVQCAASPVFLDDGRLAGALGVTCPTDGRMPGSAIRAFALALGEELSRVGPLVADR